MNSLVVTWREGMIFCLTVSNIKPWFLKNTLRSSPPYSYSSTPYVHFTSPYLQIQSLSLIFCHLRSPCSLVHSCPCVTHVVPYLHLLLGNLPTRPWPLLSLSSQSLAQCLTNRSLSIHVRSINEWSKKDVNERFAFYFFLFFLLFSNSLI